MGGFYNMYKRSIGFTMSIISADVGNADEGQDVFNVMILPNHALIVRW